MNRIGKVWWHGMREKRGFRWWMYFGESGHKICMEFSRTRWLFAKLEVNPGDGSALGVSLGFILGAVWLRWEFPYRWAKRLRFPSGERENGFQWGHGELRLLVWHDPMGPMGRMHRNSRPVVWSNEWVTGRDCFSKVLIAEGIPGMVKVGWWDGDEYPVTCKLEQMEWRNRFRTKRRLSWWMEADRTAPPVPGKGENAWDIEDDGIYATGADALTCGGLEGALAKYAESVERDRLRYRSRDWVPDSMRAEA